MKRNKKNFLVAIIVSATINAILLIVYEPVRSSLPPPEISSNKLVGFAHYYGYPLYFDTIFFFILVLVPFATFLIFFKLKK